MQKFKEYYFENTINKLVLSKLASKETISKLLNINLTNMNQSSLMKENTKKELDKIKKSYEYSNIELFRGLTFHEERYNELLKNKITNNKFFKHNSKEPSSWTTDKIISEKIANGKDDYLHNEGDFGIVLKYNFNIKDVLFDYNYFDKEDLIKLGFEFLEQKEVLIIPGNFKTQIISFIRL